MQNRTRTLILAAAVAAPLAALGGVAFGQAETWDGGGADDNWSTDANWLDDSAPPLVQPNQAYRFVAPGTTQLVTDMDNNYEFGQLQFQNVGGTVINSSTGSTMSLSGFNTGQVITSQAGLTSTVNVPIVLDSMNTTNNAGEANRRTVDTNTGTVILNGMLTANANPARNFNVRKIGAGTLTLNAANVITGTFESTNGDVRLGNNLALGTATVINSSGNTVRFLSSDGTVRTLANNFTFAGTGAFVFTETGGPNATLTGSIATGPSGTLQTLGGGVGTTTTINGVISGAGGISKATAGSTIVLNGNNTYTGATNVGNGTLVVNGTSVSDTNVGGGILQGTGQARILSVFGDTTTAGPEGTLSIAGPTAAGAFTAGRADFGVGGTFRLTLNSAAAGAGVGFDQLVLNGNGNTPNNNLSVSATGGSFVIELVGGSGFDGSTSFTIPIVLAGDVTGAGPTDPFNPAGIAVDSSMFGGNLNGGTFSVAEVGTNLNLVFTAGAIPEPTSLAVLGLGGLGLLRRRRA